MSDLCTGGTHGTHSSLAGGRDEFAIYWTCHTNVHHNGRVWMETALNYMHTKSLHLLWLWCRPLTNRSPAIRAVKTLSQHLRGNELGSTFEI